MGYIDIQGRENIDKNICESLSSYYNIKVIISKKYNADSYILCPRLNTAIFDKASKKVRTAVKIGHAIHGNSFKKVAMGLFLKIAFSKTGLFNCKYIQFDKLPANCDDVLIMPGNMKIKVFDYCAGIITNIQKPGFSADGFENEKSIRTTGTFDFVLPMTIINDNVYCEKLLSGCSLDRLSLDRVPDAEKKVKKILENLQQCERNLVSAKHYVNEKRQYIVEKLNNLQCADKMKIQLASFVDTLSGFVKDDVLTSKSHGDFQNGNIYITDTNEVYLLDWETVGIRSIGYDLLTYFYKFRYRSDFIGRIDFYLKDVKWTNVARKCYGREADKKEVLATYFIEDIIWLLDESCATSEKRPSDGLCKYASLDFQKEILERLKDEQ